MRRTFLHRCGYCLILALVSLWTSIGACGQEPTKAYHGFIKGIPITMKLQQKGEAVIGTYQYVKVGKDLAVEGILRGKDSILLKEFNEQERQTGLFQGRYAGKGTKTDSIVGVWSRPDGSKPLPFSLRAVGTIAPPTPFDFYTGRYKRPGKHSAEISVQRLPDGKLKIEGEAYWIGNNDNIHTGDISGIVSVKDFQAVYTDQNMPCKLTLIFGSDEKIKKAIITVSGDDGNCGGMNVTFNGTYKYIGLPTLRTK